MIKKMFFVFLMVCMALGVTMGSSSRSDEYKVIQNAVKKEKTDSTVAATKVVYFRLEVFQDGKSTVKIKIPLSLIEVVANTDSGDDLVAGKGKDRDLRKILDELKKGGPMAAIEIEDKGELVRIWIE